MYRNLIKPLFDFLAAAVLIIILSPLFLVLTSLLTIANRGNPLFIQRRTGLNGRIFPILKFRTMDNKRAADGSLLPDFERLHGAGRFVRKYSLDELPQLFNVLGGQMSLVGPRPLLPEYLSLYNEEQSKRHLVKPGVTGWAQINGRNAISWNEKFSLDAWYAEKISFRLDMLILIRTALKLFRPSGVNSSQNETMGRFTGNTTQHES